MCLNPCPRLLGKITYLPSKVRGQYYYLYLIEDIYSRKAVGWEVHEAESGESAAALLQRSAPALQFQDRKPSFRPLF